MVRPAPARRCSTPTRRPGDYAVRLGVADGTGLSCGQTWDEIKVLGAPARVSTAARSAPWDASQPPSEAAVVRGGDRDPAAGGRRSHPDPDRAGRAQELGERSAGGHRPAAGRGDQRPLRADLAGAAGSDPQCARRSAAGGGGEDLPAHVGDLRYPGHRGAPGHGRGRRAAGGRGQGRLRRGVSRKPGSIPWRRCGCRWV